MGCVFSVSQSPLSLLPVRAVTYELPTQFLAQGKRKQEAGTPFFFQMNINGNCSGLLLGSMIIHMAIHEMVQTEETIRSTEFKTEF